MKRRGLFDLMTRNAAEIYTVEKTAERLHDQQLAQNPRKHIEVVTQREQEAAADGSGRRWWVAPLIVLALAVALTFVIDALT